MSVCNSCNNITPSNFLVKYEDCNGTMIINCRYCGQSFECTTNGRTYFFSLVKSKEKPKTIEPQRLIKINLLISLNKKRGSALWPEYFINRTDEEIMVMITDLRKTLRV